MPGFRFTINVRVDARNLESAIKKLVKSLYSGRSHVETHTIRAEVWRDQGGMALIRDKDVPDMKEWRTIVRETLTKITEPAQLAKKDEVAAQLYALADQLTASH